eukprot:641083-Rhodomonas_salina.2
MPEAVGFVRFAWGCSRTCLFSRMTRSVSSQQRVITPSVCSRTHLSVSTPLPIALSCTSTLGVAPAWAAQARPAEASTRHRIPRAAWPPLQAQTSRSEQTDRHRSGAR